MDETRDDRPELDAALRALAAEDAARGASAAVAGRLFEEVRGLRRARRRALMKMSLLTCGLCLAMALPIWQLATSDLRGGSRQAAAGEMVTPFFPLMYSAVPITGARLVRLEVPRETVTAFGLEPMDSTERQDSRTILADVIVGDDGLARAVRFVRPTRRPADRSDKR